MSENRPGGDDIVAAVDDVLLAIRMVTGSSPGTGPEAEALVAGYQPDCLTVEG